MNYTILEISKEQFDEMTKYEFIKLLMLQRPEGWQRILMEFHSILFTRSSNTTKNISQFQNLNMIPGFLITYYLEKYDELFNLKNIESITNSNFKTIIAKMIKLLEEGDELYNWLTQIYLYQSNPGQYSNLLM